MNQNNSGTVNADKRSKTFILSAFFQIFKSSLFFTFVIVLLLSSILLLYPQFNIVLMASSQNILGTITSIVVHRDVVHLASTMSLAFIALLLYSFSAAFSGNKKFWSMTLIIWCSAILANFVYILFFPYSNTAGSSGLLSALYGGAATLAFTRARKEHDSLFKWSQLLIGSILVLAFIIGNISVSPDINVHVHLISFFLSVVFILADRF